VQTCDSGFNGRHFLASIFQDRAAGQNVKLVAVRANLGPRDCAEPPPSCRSLVSGRCLGPAERASIVFAGISALTGVLPYRRGNN
jgi:hypothetical protein